MVFFDGLKPSLEYIAAIMDVFSSWSSLTMNRNKTHLFVVGLNQEETNGLTSLGFYLGSMPIRYLDLFMYRKLRKVDYRPMIDQVSQWFTTWSACSLSLAGRRQLIASVIYSSVNFWTSAFTLPKGCYKDIESLCSRFLWNGNITKKATANVSWQIVYLPKEEGGLGFLNFQTWNKSLCMRLI